MSACSDVMGLGLNARSFDVSGGPQSVQGLNTWSSLSQTTWVGSSWDTRRDMHQVM